MKMTLNLNKFWHEARQYQPDFVKNRDNPIKDNVTVTSSNFSRNDGTIRSLTHFLVRNHSKSTIEDKTLKQRYAFTSNLCLLKSLHCLMKEL